MGSTTQPMDFHPHMRYDGRESCRSRPPVSSEGKSLLKGDHAKRAVVAAEKIKGHLAAGEPTEAWRSLKGWYKAATDCAPKSEQDVTCRPNC